ncbi:hypothetical protein [Mycobacteroides immunogenum]|uniref:Carotenoid biosynthesis protein n=1 Tax=Mycobacteroides immunogenum TaxID=83262 RepID=A0A7V8LRJ8_9MYCO|nr:hypothetical protein [Mycobacteroides immunogenum]AMT70337.1 hypothetical protein ABG82_08360 [Mycobacteroides immunogenum]ANO03403.1 hypothetical protein BAB75_08415 [Mycobacteroides immunogenum]KIU42129.1 hypothetical protein TL11_03225 [Mycobacteroides immunogenum]KPG13425.1 hypothetical protein AN909_03690 [Mycobacteroides immunogenum]KPG14656.1 hypothetical protein AN908_09175 [Mycobacteroides immunogenum]
MRADSENRTKNEARRASPMDVALGLACVVWVVMTLWSGISTGGAGLPVIAQTVTSLALVVAVFGHMLKHLGVKMASAYFVIASIVEWAFEQANISFGGFVWGDLRYGDTPMMGPHIGSVPLLVPVGMVALLWPIYVIINVILDGRIVVNPHTLRPWQVVWHCVLYGMLHAWIAFLANGFCTKFGIYEWVGKSRALAPEDSFFGDPALPIGWAIWGFLITLIISYVLLPLLGKDALTQSEQRRLSWVDAAPVVVIGAYAFGLFLNPVNESVGSVILFMFGFISLLALYRFSAVLLNQGNP